MKNDLGKRIFIIALIACFGAMFLLLGTRETVQEMYDYQHGLENETVFIQVEDGSRMAIGGEGRISGADLKHMMEENKVKSANLTDVTVLDGITEIGYSVCNGYKYLETLKLGKGVRVVHNGAVKSCSKLKYVYMPKEIEKVGMDFMYSCGDAFVVTDGTHEDLPELLCVSPDHVLTGVRSYADFIERRNAYSLVAFGAGELLADGERTEGTESLSVEAGHALSSPAFALDPGTYTIVLSGSGLGGVSKDDVIIEADGEAVKPEGVSAGDDAVSCKINLSRRADSVVFKVANSTGGAMDVAALDVHDNSYVIPAGVMQWWD